MEYGILAENLIHKRMSTKFENNFEKDFKKYSVALKPQKNVAKSL